MTEDEIKQRIGKFDHDCRIDENWAEVNARNCNGAMCEAWACKTCGPALAVRYFEFLLRLFVRHYEEGGQIYRAQLSVSNKRELAAIRARIRARLQLHADNNHPNYIMSIAGNEAYVLATIDIGGRKPPTAAKPLLLEEAINWLTALLVTPLPAITIEDSRHMHNLSSTRGWKRGNAAPYKTSSKKRKKEEERRTKR